MTITEALQLLSSPIKVLSQANGKAKSSPHIQILLQQHLIPFSTFISGPHISFQTSFMIQFAYLLHIFSHEPVLIISSIHYWLIYDQKRILPSYGWNHYHNPTEVLWQLIIIMKGLRSNEKNRSVEKDKSQERIKSSKKDTVHHVGRTKAEPLRAFQVPGLRALTDSFDRQISSPIELQRSIFHSRTPQRCLLHNNVSTLYCINDRQPLCVTCMYQNSLHKKHKVVPLNRAGKELEEQLRSCLKIIDRSLEKTQYLIEKTQGNLQRAEKEFPEVLARISEFYEGLRGLIAQKQKEQMAHVEQTWARVRHEYSSLSNELQRVHLFSIEQLKQIGQRNGEESLLFNRNVATHLVKITEIIKDDICSYHETKYMEELRKFGEVQKILNSKLVFTSPLLEPLSKQAERSKSKTKSRSPKQKSTVITKTKNAESSVPLLQEVNKNTIDQSPPPKNQPSPVPKVKSMVSHSPSPAKVMKTSVSAQKKKINGSIERRY